MHEIFHCSLILMQKKASKQPFSGKLTRFFQAYFATDPSKAVVDPVDQAINGYALYFQLIEQSVPQGFQPFGRRRAAATRYFCFQANFFCRKENPTDFPKKHSLCFEANLFSQKRKPNGFPNTPQYVRAEIPPSRDRDTFPCFPKHSCGLTDLQKTFILEI